MVLPPYVRRQEVSHSASFSYKPNPQKFRGQLQVRVEALELATIVVSSPAFGQMEFVLSGDNLRAHIRDCEAALTMAQPTPLVAVS